MARFEARSACFYGFVTLLFVLALATSGAPRAAAQQAPPPPMIESATANLKMRVIGPALIGGRVDDIAAVESNPQVIYIGTATGGAWKSNDGGTTWTSLFDAQPDLSIGAIAVAPSNPSIVWVGTGEANNRQSSSWGDGVYKSTDGGKTWKHVGLEDTQAIGRIIIDPSDPAVVYVAALGHLWGPNAQRGLYKTTDGGKTWQQVLFIDSDTGVSDVAIDSVSPNILYAAAYERRRTPWGFSGGGPGSGIYKTTDGGITWTKLATGLPGNGNTGRIGLAVYQRNPNIVYALVQNAQGGVFRSEDQGATWRKMSSTDPRPSYFSQIRIDPNNDLRIWMAGVDLYFSEDGGKTFSTDRGVTVHSDFHAMWIDPRDSNSMLVGSDGGVYASRDAGRNWSNLNVMPLGQIYEVAYDNQQPYHVCAGYQDNGEWCGPSRTLFGGGILNGDWLLMGGGDGTYVKPNPVDPQIIYLESSNGNLIRRELRTGEAHAIRPAPGHAADPPYRFDWNAPLLISPYDPNTIYLGGNYLFRSNDRGESWTKLGGDLTTGTDRNTLAILDKLPSNDTLSLNDGVSSYPALTTIAQSPRNPTVIWVGTDDGNLQVTRDGGETWTNVADRLPGVPKGTYVSRVIASNYGEGTAFVACDGHRADDFHVYLLKTTDYGQTWTSLAADLPESAGTVKVVREHPSDRNLLFAGTEFGAFFSLDGGFHWNALKMGLPAVPVDDIEIQPRENDLILGTHGRSIYILDDLTPIEQLTPQVLSEDLHLFSIRPAIEWRLSERDWFTGDQIFVGPNPPYGALLDFFLRTKPAKGSTVKINIFDPTGKVVREMEVNNAEAGINRVNWDLCYPPQPLPPTAKQLVSQAQGIAAAEHKGPLVEPGAYTVKVALGNVSRTETVKVEEDPRIQVSPADRAAHHAAVIELYTLAQTADQGQRTLVGLRQSLNDTLAAWNGPRAPKIAEGIQAQAAAFSKKLDELSGKFLASGVGGQGGNLHYTPPALPQAISRLLIELEDFTGAPTATQKEQISSVSGQLKAAMNTLDGLVHTDLAHLNKALDDAGAPHILAVQ